jgi:ABC-type Mn2+/Zn2+ transport system permease subunit
LFTLVVASLVWVSIKIFWTLLIWAFIVIPANIWKALGKSFRQMTYIAVIVNIFATVLGLCVSAIFDTSPWASIVLILGVILITSLLWKGLKKS